jgi:hypothetical protein
MKGNWWIRKVSGLQKNYTKEKEGGIIQKRKSRRYNKQIEISASRSCAGEGIKINHGDTAPEVHSYFCVSLCLCNSVVQKKFS